jgi:hypothetical protein
MIELGPKAGYIRPTGPRGEEFRSKGEPETVETNFSEALETINFLTP